MINPVTWRKAQERAEMAARHAYSIGSMNTYYKACDRVVYCKRRFDISYYNR